MFVSLLRNFFSGETAQGAAGPAGTTMQRVGRVFVRACHTRRILL